MSTPSAMLLSAVTVLIARGTRGAWSPECEHDEETHEGLVRFGPERPGTRPNPPGIIRPGSKSGPTWNHRSFWLGPKWKWAIPSRSRPSSAWIRSTPQYSRNRSRAWRTEGLADEATRVRRRAAEVGDGQAVRAWWRRPGGFGSPAAALRSGSYLLTGNFLVAPLLSLMF